MKTWTQLVKYIHKRNDGDRNIGAPLQQAKAKKRDVIPADHIADHVMEKAEDPDGVEYRLWDPVNENHCELQRPLLSPSTSDQEAIFSRPLNLLYHHHFRMPCCHLNR